MMKEVRGREEVSSSNLRRLRWSIHIRKGRHRTFLVNVGRQWTCRICLRTGNQPATTPLPSNNFIVLISNDEDNGVYSRMEGSETLHCHGNSLPSRSISFFISVSRGDTRDSRGRKMWTLGRDRIRFFWYSRMFRNPPYSTDVVTTTRCYFFKFISHGIKTRWPRGNAISM